MTNERTNELGEHCLHDWAPARYRVRVDKWNGDVCVCVCFCMPFWVILDVSCLLFHLSTYYASYIITTSSSAQYGAQMPCVWQTHHDQVCWVLRTNWNFFKICCRRRFRQKLTRIDSNAHTHTTRLRRSLNNRLPSMAVKQAHFVLFCFFLFMACASPVAFIYLSTRRAPVYMTRSIWYVTRIIIKASTASIATRLAHTLDVIVDRMLNTILFAIDAQQSSSSSFSSMPMISAVGIIAFDSLKIYIFATTMRARALPLRSKRIYFIRMFASVRSSSSQVLHACMHAMSGIKQLAMYIKW